MIPIKIGTAFAFPLGPFVASTDGYTIVSALAIGTSNVRILSNGGAAWVSKSTATTPAYQELGYYLATFTSTDFAAQGHHRVAVSMTSAGGALPVWQDFWASETSELAVALTSGARSTAIDLIWDEATTGHGTVGTAGASIAFPTSSVSFLAAAQTALVTAVTTSVWAEALASHTTAGSAGYYIVTNLLTPTSAAVLSSAGVQAVTTGVWGELLASHTTAGAAGKKLSDLAMSTDMLSVLTASSAIQAKTTNLPATPASSTDAMRLATTALDLIWDEAFAGHITAGTFGVNLQSPTSGVLLTAAGVQAVTTSVWAEPLLSHTTAGAVGKKLSDLAMSTDVVSVLTASSQIQAKTTNLPATPASSTSFLNWAMSTDMASVLTASSQIQAKTTNLPAEPAGSSHFTTLMTSTGSTQMADAVWNVISESTQTHADQIRTMRSALAGEAMGGGTATIKFRDAADTIDRLTFTATTAGNRTAVVLVTT